MGFVSHWPYCISHASSTQCISSSRPPMYAKSKYDAPRASNNCLVITANITSHSTSGIIVKKGKKSSTQIWNLSYRYNMESAGVENQDSSVLALWGGTLPSPTVLCCRIGRTDGENRNRMTNPAKRPGGRCGSSSILSLGSKRSRAQLSGAFHTCVAIGGSVWSSGVAQGRIRGTKMEDYIYVRC